MKRYVLGFMFSEDREEVAVIRKTKPQWQAGKLNGVGGKLEAIDANPIDGMIREFREETGVEYKDWQFFGIAHSPDWHIALYRAFSDEVYKVQSPTEERVTVVPVSWVQQNERISNLDWLIPAALDKNNIIIDVRFPCGSL